MISYLYFAVHYDFIPLLGSVLWFHTTTIDWSIVHMVHMLCMSKHHSLKYKFMLKIDLKLYKMCLVVVLSCLWSSVEVFWFWFEVSVLYSLLSVRLYRLSLSLSLFSFMSAKSPYIYIYIYIYILYIYIYIYIYTDIHICIRKCCYPCVCMYKETYKSKPTYFIHKWIMFVFLARALWHRVICLWECVFLHIYVNIQHVDR